MAAPEVNMKLLEELEGMGFTRARATRALHHSGNAGIEAAVNWIIDHENDPDIDQMPRVSIDVDIGPPEPQFLTEAMKIKAQELRNRAQKKNQAEKNLEKEREGKKERIRAGKEHFEAKRTAEDNERRRFVASKKAEKEEEKRAREQILQKLKNDKLERRTMLGLPSENPRALNPSIPCPENNTKSSSLYSTSKAEQMREWLRSIRRNHKTEDSRVKRAFETLLIYIGNVAKNPGEEKLRRIRLSNALFQERVGSLKGGVEFLELCGFEKTQGGEFLFLPQNKVDIALLHLAGYQLKSALTNPFFGLL